MDGVTNKQGQTNIHTAVLQCGKRFGHRQTILGPYHERLHGHRPTMPTTSGPNQSTEIGLDRWEQMGLRHVLDYGQPTTVGLALLFDGIALRTKVNEEMDRLESGRVRGEELRSLVAELITDAAIGLVLMVESQTLINETINAGNIREAKHLSSFRNRLRDVTNRIVDRLGDAAHRKAQAICEAVLAKSNSSATAKRRAGVA
jgi:hypothetical protein